jgi:hypothetical protein
VRQCHWSPGISAGEGRHDGLVGDEPLWAQGDCERCHRTATARQLVPRVSRDHTLGPNLFPGHPGILTAEQRVTRAHEEGFVRAMYHERMDMYKTIVPFHHVGTRTLPHSR